MLGEAIAFAACAHVGQRDKNGDPYILHPLRVMMAVREKGYPETYAVAAVLHDVVEDCEGYTLEQIRERFGETVARGVDAMTRRTDPKTGEWAETYNEYIERCLKSPIGMAIKECDVQDNMNPSRFHPDVPYGRYLKTLTKIREIEEERHGLGSGD